MIYVFITGDSSGIGKSLREQSIGSGCNTIGFSRRSRPSAKNYKAIEIDLSNLDELKKFKFPEIKNSDKIILVNNAGQVGPIKPLFDQTEDEIYNLFQINTVAPAILCSKFIKTYFQQEKMIINISSGAANNAIQGWSTYCASKSALDMLSKTLIEDLKFKKDLTTKVYSVSPGVIDTNMQKEIRSAKEENFSNLLNFQDLKSNGELVNPDLTASFVLKIILESDTFPEPFINLRDYY